MISNPLPPSGFYTWKLTKKLVKDLVEMKSDQSPSPLGRARANCGFVINVSKQAMPWKITSFKPCLQKAVREVCGRRNRKKERKYLGDVKILKLPL